MVVERKVDGLREAVGRQLHQLARAERHGGKTQHRRIPAAARDVDGVEETAIHLIHKDDRGDEIRNARALGFGDGETWRDMVARVTGEPGHVRVIQIVVTEGRTIRKGCEIGRNAPACPDDRRGAGAARHGDLAADAHWWLVERRDPAAERVDDERFDLLDGGGIEIVITKAMSIISETLSEGSGRLGARRLHSARDDGSADGKAQELTALERHDASPSIAPRFPDKQRDADDSDFRHRREVASQFTAVGVPSVPCADC
jgi:hypothetical protein